MTLRELKNKIDSFDLDKYGDCHVYRPYGHWDNTEIETITLEEGINDFNEPEMTLFIDFNDAG